MNPLFRFGRPNSAATAPVAEVTLPAIAPTAEAAPAAPEAAAPGAPVAPTAPAASAPTKPNTTPDTAAARAEGAAAERARIAGILSAEAAAGREDMALHLALETDTPAAAAAALLGKAPKASAGNDYQPTAGLGGLELAGPAAATKPAAAKIDTAKIYNSRRVA